jgi:hypothetical protein
MAVGVVKDAVSRAVGREWYRRRHIASEGGRADANAPRVALMLVVKWLLSTLLINTPRRSLARCDISMASIITHVQGRAMPHPRICKLT